LTNPVGVRVVESSGTRKAGFGARVSRPASGPTARAGLRAWLVTRHVDAAQMVALGDDEAPFCD
jgi:hypothetical protein